MGPTINRAARLRELGYGGQTLVSGTTSDLVRELLPEQAWLKDFGRYALRDLSRPERVTQLCHPDLHNYFPPLRTRDKVASASAAESGDFAKSAARSPSQAWAALADSRERWS